MSNTDKALIRLLRNAVTGIRSASARAELLRIIRMVEAGCHLTPDGRPL